MSANGARIRPSSIRWAQSREQGSLASPGNHFACGRGPGIPGGEERLSQVGALAAAATDICRALLGSLDTLT